MIVLPERGFGPFRLNFITVGCDCSLPNQLLQQAHSLDFAKGAGGGLFLEA